MLSFSLDFLLYLFFPPLIIYCSLMSFVMVSPLIFCTTYFISFCLPMQILTDAKCLIEITFRECCFFSIYLFPCLLLSFLFLFCFFVCSLGFEFFYICLNGIQCWIHVFYPPFQLWPVSFLPCFSRFHRQQ